MQQLMNARALVCVLAGLCAAAVPTVAGGKALRTRSLIGSAAPGPAGASVNICGDGTGTLGVRATAPWRGADLAPWIRIAVDYYSTADGAWHPVGAGGDSGWFQAGGPGAGADTGYTFPFNAPHAGHRLLMRAGVQIQWRGPSGTRSAELGTAPCEVKGDGGQAPPSGGGQPLAEKHTTTVHSRPVEKSDHAAAVHRAAPAHAVAKHRGPVKAKKQSAAKKPPAPARAQPAAKATG
ncbi:MAG TPA: hypothetical protein VIM22_11210 [Solirubrobacteraceae bacterium]|jgi:hypothetical protein